MGKSLANGRVVVFNRGNAQGGSMDGRSNGLCSGEERFRPIVDPTPNLKVTYSNLKVGDLDTTY
jgi:hypothetical protein